jgi:hypothetical protein
LLLLAAAAVGGQQELVYVVALDFVYLLVAVAALAVLYLIKTTLRLFPVIHIR